MTVCRQSNDCRRLSILRKSASSVRSKAIIGRHQGPAGPACYGADGQNIHFPDSLQFLSSLLPLPEAPRHLRAFSVVSSLISISAYGTTLHVPMRPFCSSTSVMSKVPQCQLQPLLETARALRSLGKRLAGVRSRKSGSIGDYPEGAPFSHHKSLHPRLLTLAASGGYSHLAHFHGPGKSLIALSHLQVHFVRFMSLHILCTTFTRVSALRRATFSLKRGRNSDSMQHSTRLLKSLSHQAVLITVNYSTCSMVNSKGIHDETKHRLLKHSSCPSLHADKTSYSGERNMLRSL